MRESISDYVYAFTLRWIFKTVIHKNRSSIAKYRHTKRRITMKHSQCCFGAHTLFMYHFQNGILAPRATKGTHLKNNITIIHLFNRKCLTQWLQTWFHNVLFCRLVWSEVLMWIIMDTFLNTVISCFEWAVKLLDVWPMEELWLPLQMCNSISALLCQPQRRNVVLL